MTRTLLCIDHAPVIGGQTRVLLTALAALDRARFRAVVACNPGPVAEEVRCHGHEAIPMSLPMLTFAGGPAGWTRSALAWLRASRDLARIARERAPVALWSQGLVSTLYAARAARRARVPLVWHVHEMYDDRLRMVPFVRIAAARSRAIVCVSRAAAERTIRLGAAASKCHVVHNALPAPLSGCSPGPADRAAAADVPEGPLVVAVGSITPGKGHHVLVEAMAEVVRRHPRATAVIVGEPLLSSDVRYADELRRAIERLDLSERVRMLGFRRDAAAILSAADVVVHPSIVEETFGLVPLEAMTLGRAVVASRVGGVPEVVSDGETGVLVPPGDAPAVADAIAVLLSDPDRRERMGLAGARAAAERFGVGSFLAALDAAFSDAAGAEPFVRARPSDRDRTAPGATC